MRTSYNYSVLLQYACPLIIGFIKLSLNYGVLFHNLHIIDLVKLTDNLRLQSILVVIPRTGHGQ